MDPQQKLYEQGLALMKYNRYADALCRFEDALDYAATDAASAETWFRIGCCRSEIAKQKIESAEETLYVDGEFELYEGTIEAYQKVIELQPDHSEVRMVLGTLFYDFGIRGSEEGMCEEYDYRRVVEWFEQAIEFYPTLIDAYYELGFTYTLMMEDFENNAIYQIDDSAIAGIPDARIKTYQKLTEIQPSDARAYYELGNAYSSWIDPFLTPGEIEEMEQDKEAIGAYRTAIGIKPDYADAYSRLATVYQRLGQCEDAIQAFQQAIVLDNKGRNNLASAYHQLGKQHFADGNYMRAIECYHNAIVTASRDYHNEMHYDLAVAYHDAGRYELAIWTYRRVRSAYNYPSDLFRRYPDLLYRLGTACHKCSCYQDAVDAYQEAIDYQTAMEEEYYQIDLWNCKDEYHKIHSSDPFEYPEFDYPEWWEDVYQNLESASRNKPL